MDASTAVPLHLAGLEEFRDSGLLDLGSHFEMGVHLLTAIYFIINFLGLLISILYVDTF